MNKLIAMVGILALGLVIPAGASAQEQRVVSITSLVSVNVIVTDRNGRYVRGLTRDDFHVFDGRVKQDLAHFSSEPAPVSIGIVCEVRGTASGRTQAMLAALRQFTANLRAGDDFFFTAFGDQGSLTIEFVPTADQVLGHLTAVKPGGPAALYDAVYAAAGRLRKARNLKKALLIVSDGEDNQSRISYKILRNRLREFDVQIYAVGIADPAIDRTAGYGRWVFQDITRETTGRAFLAYAEASTGRAVLSEMARVSGGTVFYPQGENEPELVGICTQIAVELRQQYTLGFYPANVSSNKTWHRIRIVLDPANGRRGLSLSYRQGYRLAIQPREETVTLSR